MYEDVLDEHFKTLTESLKGGLTIISPINDIAIWLSAFFVFRYIGLNADKISFSREKG